jgi:hypothetical protein
MLFDWFGQTAKTPAASKSRQPLRSRPQIEALEGRLVPNAIRSVPGFTTNSLPHEDDDPSPSANVGFNLNFFGVQSSQVFVNNNGNITFGTPFATFTPTALNSNNGGIPIIAPFFADVDTRPANSPVVTYGTGTLCGFQAFAVNYLDVGFFANHTSPTDSFQVVLIDRADTGAGNFDIEFNYDNIQWETGDASGGTNGLGGDSARVGFSNGSGIPGTFFELPGSGVNGAFLDGGTNALVSNSIDASTPGRLHFLVRDGVISMAPPVNNDVTAQVRVFYPLRYVSEPGTDIQSGNLTLLNLPGTNSASCLDETGTNGGGSALTGPFNIIFTNMPSNVQLVNATGVTASGRPFLTVDLPSLPQGAPCGRAPILLRNTGPVPTTTFEMGYQVRVFAGAFDPTIL